MINVQFCILVYLIIELYPVVHTFSDHGYISLSYSVKQMQKFKDEVNLLNIYLIQFKCFLFDVCVCFLYICVRTDFVVFG